QDPAGTVADDQRSSALNKRPGLRTGGEPMPKPISQPEALRANGRDQIRLAKEIKQGKRGDITDDQQRLSDSTHAVLTGEPLAAEDLAGALRALLAYQPRHLQTIGR